MVARQQRQQEPLMSFGKTKRIRFNDACLEAHWCLFLREQVCIKTHIAYMSLTPEAATE